MPQLPHYDEDDEKVAKERRKDFDCPECSANNPYDDGFSPGDEIRCYYCGQEFRVEIGHDGRWKYREI